MAVACSHGGAGRGRDACAAHTMVVLCAALALQTVVAEGEEPSQPPVETTEGANVNCGGHRAFDCSQCSAGHGEGWCNGDCAWYDGDCLPKAEAAARKAQAAARVAESQAHALQRDGHPPPHPLILPNLGHVGGLGGGPAFVAKAPVALHVSGIDHIDPLGLMLGGLGQIVAGQNAARGRLQGQVRQLKGHPMQPMIGPMQALMKAIGDASGHLGEASDFNVSDKEDLFQITAHLPGHMLDQEGRGKDPLCVRIVGRHVVVKGRHVNGNVMFEFQRSFKIPPRANVSDIHVDYSTTTGNLIINLPKRPHVDGEDEHALAEEGGPVSPFADLQRSLHDFFGEGERLTPGGNLRRSVNGPDPKKVQELFSDVVEKPHRPRTISARVKDDNTTYLGCFAENELPEQRSKLEVHASSGALQDLLTSLKFGGFGTKNFRFLAVAVRQPTATSLSQAPGAAFAFMDTPHMPPAHGTEGCGHHCDVDGADERWCGCIPSPQEPISSCPESSGTRFAVYMLPMEDGSRASLPRSRPVWQLGSDKDGSPMLEVHAPPGRKLKQDAGKLFVVKDDRRADQVDATDRQTSDAIADKPDAPDHLGHVGVPVDLSEHDCALSDEGSELKCKLKEERVKEVPVRYTKDEL